MTYDLENNLVNVLGQANEQIDNIIADNSPYYSTNELAHHVSNTKIQKSHNNNNLSILNLNIQSLANSEKRDLLKCFINDLSINSHFQFDILTLQETWLDSNLENLINIHGYKPVFKHKIGTKRGGGLAIFINNNLNYTLRKDLQFPTQNQHLHDCLFVEISNTSPNISQKTILIGTIYRAPSSQNLETFNTDVEELLSKLHKKNIIITGDFNTNLLQLNTHLLTAKFFDIMLEHLFIPKITLPTRITNNTSTLIDNIFVKSDSNTISAGIIDTSISDHFPMFVILDINLKINKPTFIKYRKITQTNLQNFIKDLNKQDWSPCTMYSDTDIDHQTEKFSNTYSQLYRNNFPMRKIKFNKYKHKLQQWLTGGILTSIKNKDKQAKKIKKETNINKKNVLMIKYKTYCKTLNSIMKNAKSLFWKQKFEKSKHDIKQTWIHINNILNKNKNKPEIPNTFYSERTSYTGTSAICNEFNNYFSKIGNTLSNSTNTSTNNFKTYMRPEKRIPNSLFLNKATENEILQIVKNMKNKSSSGADDISPKIIKSTIWSIITPLTKLINTSIQTGRVPTSFKIAKITPVFKNKENTSFQNYRPIALLPTFSKILEKIMYNRLSSFITKHNILYPHQYGFRKFFSTEQAILDLQNHILQNLKENYLTAGIFLDLSKAFDLINHDILLEKLNYYGVRGIALEWFKSYLTDRQQYVTVGDGTSAKESVNLGVPQGSILGPLLFIIYMNDIPNSSQESKLILFADDTTVLYKSKTTQQLNLLINKDMSNLTNWFKTNKLLLNPNKSKLIIFQKQNTNKVPNNISLNIDGTIIKPEKNTLFLGIQIQNNLKWNSHISSVCNKLSKTNYILKQLKRHLPTHILRLIYTSLFVPYIQYGILTWYNSPNYNLQRVAKLQKRAIRSITNAKYNAHTNPLLHHLKLLKIEDIYSIKAFTLYWKAKNNQTSPFIKESFTINESIHSHFTRQSNNIHTSKIYTELDRQGLDYQFYTILKHIPNYIKNKTTANIHYLKKKLKQELIEKYKTLCLIQNCRSCKP